MFYSTGRNGKRPVALVIDGSRQVIALLTKTLIGLGCEVHSATDAEAGLALASHCHPDFVLVDLAIGPISGWLVAAKLKLCEPGPRVLLMSDDPAAEQLSFATFLSVDLVLTKPLTTRELGKLSALVRRGQQATLSRDAIA